MLARLALLPQTLHDLSLVLSRHQHNFFGRQNRTKAQGDGVAMGRLVRVHGGLRQVHAPRGRGVKGAARKMLVEPNVTILPNTQQAQVGPAAFRIVRCKRGGVRRVQQSILKVRRVLVSNSLGTQCSPHTRPTATRCSLRPARAIVFPRTFANGRTAAAACSRWEK